jgi:hypothetical protein
MKSCLSTIILVVVLICGTISIPQNLSAHEDVGTTGFNFLRVIYSARATALGNAYTAMSDDTDAVFFNPAGLPNARSKGIATTYMNYFEGFQGGSVVYISPSQERLSFGIFAQYLGNQSITRTMVDEQGEYMGTAGTFGANDIVVGFASGYYIHEFLNLGASIRYISESLEDYSASAAVIDLGVLHQTMNENLKVGVTLKNVGTQITYYTATKYREKMPTQVTVGFNYRFHEKFVGNLDILKPLDNDFSGRIGLEYRLHPILTLRTGFDTRTDDWKMGGDYDFFSGLSGGFGINYNNYELNYGITSYGDLGLVNQITLKYLF